MVARAFAREIKLFREHGGSLRMSEVLRLGELKYQEGSESLLNLFTVRNSAEAAESALVANRRARLDQWITLHTALGGNPTKSTPLATHLIKVACEAALGKRDRLEVFGTDYPTPDGTCVRDYVHVTDLADAHVRALAGLASASPGLDAYNLGNGRGFTVREIIAAAERVTGLRVPVSITSRRAGDPAVLVGDATRARHELGWQPRHAEIDEILATAWRWEQRLRELNRELGRKAS